MSRWKTSLLVLTAGTLLAGCVPSQQALRNESDLATMKQRLARLEQSAASQQSSDTKDRIDALSRQQADLQASFEALRVDLQSISGRLADMDSKRKQLRNDVDLMQNDLGLKISALETRLQKLAPAVGASAAPAPATGPSASAPAATTVAKPAAATTAKPVAAAAPAAKPQNPGAAPAPATPAPAAAAKNADALYHQGLDLVQKKKDYPQAVTVFKDFLKRYPDHPLAVNAMYWIGEAYYGEKKYENAILQFQEVIQKYGDHPKVAAALLKQGMAFHELGDDQNAETILKKLIATFPLSGETTKAKKILADWQKSSPAKTK
ncbi:MAG TPA: tol-pal system protein YbgF [Desulfuromonadales bacterium]|nr:tol-pal system protein YbgF [Desulfuromonadales bacterium]